MTETPLDRVLAASFTLLEAGAQSPAHPFHILTLASLGQDGAPRQRSVVLRQAAPAARLLEIHTDTRSAKVAELIGNPLAALHGWDADGRVQLRLEGRIDCRSGDAAARAAWEKLGPHTRATYRVVPGPGTPLPAPDATQACGEDEGFSVFAVLCFTFHTLEWLRLEHGSYARARFRWDGAGRAATWLVP